MEIADSLEKTLMLGMIEGWKRNGTTEDDVFGWHHRLNGHKFELTLGDRGNPGMLQFMESRRVRHDLATEQQKEGILNLILKAMQQEAVGRF